MDKKSNSPELSTEMSSNRRLSNWNGLLVPILAITLMIGCGKTPPPDPPTVNIHTAVITGDLRSVQQHIAAGSNLNEPDAATRSTPLMNAAVLRGLRSPKH